MDFRKYIIPSLSADSEKLLEQWEWLVGKDKRIYLITKAGDLVLLSRENKVFFLNTGYGELTPLVDSITDFETIISNHETFNEIFFAPIVDKLERAGKILNPGQVYSYLKLPLIGGTYDLKNIYCLDVHEHFRLTGELNYKLKDLPDRTKISLNIT